MNSKDILQETIWNNKYFKNKGKTIYFKSWIKSGIRYVKDIFDRDGLKDINKIGRQLCNKTNWLCEYAIISKNFRNLIKYIKPYEVEYINIKNKRLFHFHDKYSYIEDQKCKFFYEILVNDKFESPRYHKYYEQKFEICQSYWKNIYHHKIKLALDKNIAEFNYKLLQNMLCCRKQLFKWKKESTENCIHCNETEDIQHLIFSCKNVKNIWIVLGLTLQINITNGNIF